MVIIYGNPKDLHALKEAIESVKSDIEFEIDEISMLPKDKITLDSESLEIFNRLMTMLDDIEDVTDVYHNVEM